MNATIQFETLKEKSSGGKLLWTITKDFNDERHMNNFIDYICRTKGYNLDELYINNKTK